jgi:hypothetical protein
MTIILLNSSIDNFIINLIVGSTAVMFLFKWAKNKLKTKNCKPSSLMSDEIENRFDNYTFKFENNNLTTKPFELRTRSIAIVMSLIIVIMPLYELIETLRPQAYYYGWNCLPNFLTAL